MNFLLCMTWILALFTGCGQEEPKQPLEGGSYYVSPHGDDLHAGSFDFPWKSWSRAFSMAMAGDTIYFRGGTYVPGMDHGGERGFNSGTAVNPICFFAYPGETPILDCSGNSIEGMPYNKGVSIKNVQYVQIKGLHVVNVRQPMETPASAGHAAGIELHHCEHILLENLVIGNVEGVGVEIGDCTEILLKNCDAHDLCDCKSTGVFPAPGSPGQNGSGYYIYNIEEGSYSANSRIYFEACRAWNFSDNGFEVRSRGFVEWDHCWAFNGGELDGEGCGWKYGAYGKNSNRVAMVVSNCIGAVNGAYGFSPNNRGREYLSARVLNNVAYHNGYKIEGHSNGHGFIIWDYADAGPYEEELYANNISYDNELGEVMIQDRYNHSHNSWDLPVKVGPDDFQSLDWQQLLRPRKPDGSLPDITFMKLTGRSDLRMAGKDVGLPFEGSAPDLGVGKADY